MDSRTRARLPVLPVLVEAVARWRRESRLLLDAGRDTPPGEQFTAAGTTLTRIDRPHAAPGNIWVRDPDTDTPLLLNRDEEHAFWAWAVVEVLRHTGVRVEELLELGHQSLIQYRLPSTGELVPLLQIAPSKTDAELNGLPPHIAQIIAGHRDIGVTMGYKAVYPDEAITAHLAFIARRRKLRPTEEYRQPTDEEWQQFLGHFERRKVSVGTCGRAFGTACIHEHACVRCALLWPDPKGRSRLLDIRDNLQARIAEAEREGWLGEVEGLQVSLAGAEDKLTQIDRHRTTTTDSASTDLGIPTLTSRS